MFNLLIKDLIIQKKTFWYLLFYIPVLLLVFSSTTIAADIATALYATCTCLVGYLLIAGACAYDEQNRSEIFLNSLPIRRKDIVLSKYLSIFVYAVIGLAVGIVIAMINNLFGLGEIVRYPAGKDLLGALCGIVLIGASYYPLYFKFGNIKTRFLNVIVILAIFLIPAGLMWLVEKYSQGTAYNLLTRVLSSPDWLQVVVIGVVFLMIFAMSLASSLRIYENKDLY
ncbi:MAG: ABC-2 transporter permease [Syntrophaceticus sp.]